MEQTYSPLTNIEESIKKALLRADSERDEPGYGTGTFAAAFFRIWMKEEGNAYYFLFHKNLRVTNMQHAELVALVTAYTYDKVTMQQVRTIQFVSTGDFISRVQALWEAVPIVGGSDHRVGRAEWFAKTYAHLLYHAVVIDSFFGSSSVHLPPHLDAHLSIICGLSGYIHSCGRNVFVRNVSKARPSHFQTAMSRYLERYGPAQHERLFFSVYAHEDFSDVDRPRAALWKDGLDDVKIHIDKAHMSDKTMVDVVRHLRSEFEDRLEVAEPDNFRRKLDVCRERTLWLVSDFGIQRLIGESGEERLARARRRYYICYDQLFDNKNPFHVFDENKPAWVAHTTIPHTLMGAMINVTLPDWQAKNARIADPFVGSGTTWIEAWKFPEVQVVAGDKSEIAVAAAGDNALFFSLPIEDLRQLGVMISAVAEQVEEPAASSSRMPRFKQAKQRRVLELSQRVMAWEGLDVSDSSVGAELSSEHDFTARIIFYIVLRAHRRHLQALKRSELAWADAFVKEATALGAQVEKFVDISAREELRSTLSGALTVCEGDYSNSVTLARQRLDGFAAYAESNLPKIADATSLESLALKGEGFDLIVTDPPYGFNTDEDAAALACLYADVLRAAVRALKSGGQLVVCVPEMSTIGKDPSAFTHRTIIAHQVIAFAAESGKEVVSPCRTVPTPKLLFHPPYYWASERALRRSILHFRIVDRQSCPHC